MHPPSVLKKQKFISRPTIHKFLPFFSFGYFLVLPFFGFGVKLDRKALRRYKQAMEIYAPEEIVDKYHPANDAYLKNRDRLKQLIVAAERNMRPKKVLALKAHFLGRSNIEISETYNVTSGTISNYIKSKDGKAFLDLLAFYQQTTDICTSEQRLHMLWRIATDNEAEAPKVAIQAIAEINKYDPTLRPEESDNHVTVTINMPKGALDA